MQTVEIKKWADFRSWIDDVRSVAPLLWRGQRSATWPLASTFERSILRMNGGLLPNASQLYPYDGRFIRGGKRTWEDGFVVKMRDRYLVAFKEAATGLRGENPAELVEEQWWALGRHFGLMTPLLDWTYSPYIAAFFALSDFLAHERGPGAGLVLAGKQIAIYQLVHNDSLQGDGLRVCRPIVHELGRMHGQRGLFTWLESEEYFELQGFVDNTGRGHLLTKILLSDQAILDGLRDLRAHAIDYRLLFPDLFGAAMHANTMWDTLP